jgi:hypothetical protein
VSLIFVSALDLPACLLLVLTVGVSLLVCTGWKIKEKCQHSQEDSIAAVRVHIILYRLKERYKMVLDL